MPDALASLRHALRTRFADAPDVDPETPGLSPLADMAARGCHRAFLDKPVDPALLSVLCAVALSAPTKSDLQQRDIVIVADAEVRRRLDALVETQAWVAAAPAFLVFCGNNRRQRQVHAWRGRPFANDHLDAFFNAAVDAAITLAAFVTAAEAAGFGCCPVSAVRNRAQAVSDLLGLPHHVFPVAGLAIGWPSGASEISPRLPLAATVHVDRFDETDLRQQVEDYDRRRAAVQPYARQRFVEDFGPSEPYGWSEDKARQYAKPERPDFGGFVRRKGFDLR